MARHRMPGLTPGRLRAWLGLMFVALALPTAVLVHHAYGQLKWEAFHRQRVQAEEFGARIDDRLAALLANEEARAVTDYGFLVVTGDPSARYVERSPLATFPVDDAVPGTVGHFQVDADGRFSSPLLPAPGVQPARYGISSEELAARRARVARIHDLLGRNRLEQDSAIEAARIRPEPAPSAADLGAGARLERPDLHAEKKRAAEPAAPAEIEYIAPPSQALFDRLESESAGRELAKSGETLRSLGRVDQLKLEERYRDKDDQARQQQAAPVLQPGMAPARPASRPARKERNVLLASPPDDREPSVADGTRSNAALDASTGVPIRTFESDVDPFRFALLDGDHFILYRNVWRDSQRIVQGLLVERERFLHEQLETPFTTTALSRASDLLVAWRGDVLALFSGPGGDRYLARAEELQGELLHRTRLSAPFGGVELILSVTHLPPGPGGRVLAWVSAVLAVVFCAGFVLLYRLGLGQIQLLRQQQDFVSAVSHELKTPLTSIRMYGEMLREGWVDEAKRQDYYAYIHGESERLSRLIDNVLQLARMNRNGLQVALETTTAGALCDLVQSKVAAQIERAGFTLAIDCPREVAATALMVDRDLFLQVIINLVDNALKFAARTGPRRLDLTCRREHDGMLCIAVRDHGPGVPAGQMKKIFRLFYRPGDELTRETVGTGIGLALVHQLVTAMGGSVDVVNRDPGAEFRVRFPAN